MARGRRPVKSLVKWGEYQALDVSRVNSYAAHDEANHCVSERPNPGTLAEYKDERKESYALRQKQQMG
jgi:hypothetical protein